MSSGAASAEMPKYRCHKEVWALRVGAVMRLANGGAVMTPLDEGYSDIEVSADFMARHNPVPGDYYVVYADGYRSISPAGAFEEGYARI